MDRQQLKLLIAIAVYAQRRGIYIILYEFQQCIVLHLCRFHNVNLHWILQAVNFYLVILLILVLQSITFAKVC